MHDRKYRDRLTGARHFLNGALVWSLVQKYSRILKCWLGGRVDGLSAVMMLCKGVGFGREAFVAR